MEFFDFNPASQVQQTFMFDKIFKTCLQRGLVEKLKEVTDMNLFDPYSILIMIQTNDQCKKQLQRVYNLNVLDSLLEKLSIFVLWPRFAKIFDIHLVNIKSCDVRSFPLNQRTGLNIETTVRCYQFLSGLLRLQEHCGQLQDQNNMLRQRFAAVVQDTLRLVDRMAREHFTPPKERSLYRVNNLDFIVTQLN